MQLTVTIFAALALAAHAHGQRLERFVAGLDRPVEMVSDPTHDDRFYVLEQGGAIRVIEDGELLPEPFMEVDRRDFTDRNNEQGLLGMCLDPGWAANRRFYVNLSGRDGATRIIRYTATSPTEASHGSGEELLRVNQPYGNHNAGCLRFGPDDYLYISMGDGGAANDPHGHGQDKGTLLGAMLRIDVTGEPDDGLAYAIPDTNPFVGDDNARPELWAIGLRNVWKFEFDAVGNMWMADVGQNRFEEISFQPAASAGGENYGWNAMEARGPFKRGNRGSDPRPMTEEQHADRGFVAPLWAYRHDPIASVTGGYVYDGEALPELRGRYFFADYAIRRIWSLAHEPADSGIGRARRVRDHSAQLVRPAERASGEPLFISAFGRDNAGELYVLSHREGVIYKLVPSE